MSKKDSKQRVVWVWSEFFSPGLMDEAPSQLQKYLDKGYIIKDYNVTTYRQGKEKSPSPVYMFILEKDNSLNNE